MALGAQLEKLRVVCGVHVLHSGDGFTTGHIEFAGAVHPVGEIASGVRMHSQRGLHSTRGPVYQGTSIEICHLARTVSGMRYLLNKHQGIFQGVAL